MFSFHKPKIYRSNLGCCICKAKSSSSRFTDSKKYEAEFENCFRIKEQRSGEICNACVLLVKRWKKLSPENRLTKHWHHVVDARAGPGTKLTSGRRPAASQSLGSAPAACSSSASAQQVAGLKQRANSTRPLVSADREPLSSSNRANTSGFRARGQQQAAGGQACGQEPTGKSRAAHASDLGEPQRKSYMTSEALSLSSMAIYKPQSALNSSAFESVIKRFKQRRQLEQQEAQRRQMSRQQRSASKLISQQPAAKLELSIESVGQASCEPADKSASATAAEATCASSKRVKRTSESIGSLCVDGTRVSSLLDATIWRKEKLCCGVVFRGLHNEVVVFPKLMKPCKARNECHQRQLELQKQQPAHESDEQRDLPEEVGVPRSQKSGSISSYDSSTSGTGSMEPAGVWRSPAAESEPKGRAARRRAAGGSPAVKRARQASIPAHKSAMVDSDSASLASSVSALSTSLASGTKATPSSPGSSSSSGSSLSSCRVPPMGDNLLDGGEEFEVVDEDEPMDGLADEIDDDIEDCDEEDESSCQDDGSSLGELPIGSDEKSSSSIVGAIG